MAKSPASSRVSRAVSGARSSSPKKESQLGASAVKVWGGAGRAKPALSAFPRITRTPGVMGGKPCIKGSRMTVGMIVGQIGEGATIEELMDDFPELKREDILEAIRYAAWYSGDLLLDLDPVA